MRTHRVIDTQSDTDTHIRRQQQYPGQNWPRVKSVITWYVDSTPTSEVNTVTSRYIRPSQHGNPKVTVMVMNDRLTSLTSPHSRNKTTGISNFDLETSLSRSWVWSKGKAIHPAQYLLDLLFFHYTSIRYNDCVWSGRVEVVDLRATRKFMCCP